MCLSISRSCATGKQMVSSRSLEKVLPRAFALAWIIYWVYYPDLFFFLIKRHWWMVKSCQAQFTPSLTTWNCLPVRALRNPVQGYSPVGVQAADHQRMAGALLWGRWVPASSLCHVSSGPAWEGETGIPVPAPRALPNKQRSVTKPGWVWPLMYLC